MALPDGLMPCLSSSADSVLNDSIRVSKAESQLAVPLSMTTVFGVSVISSPNGSAVWTGAVAAGGAAGVSAAAGGGTGAGDGLACGAGVAVGAGVGVADGAGAGVSGALAAGGVAGGGDCARTLPMPIVGTSATRAKRKQRSKFIGYSPGPRASRRASAGVCRFIGEGVAILTRRCGVRPIIDTSWRSPHGRGFDHRFTTLANPPLLAI